MNSVLKLAAVIVAVGLVSVTAQAQPYGRPGYHRPPYHRHYHRPAYHRPPPPRHDERRR